MSPFSDIQETARRFGTFIDDIQRLFNFHALRIGSPESLATLEQSLATREPLREDLASLLRAINLSQPEDLPPEKILTIVALAAGGPDIASPGPELLPAVESLATYLADLQKPEVIDFSAEDPFLDRRPAPTPIPAPPPAPVETHPAPGLSPGVRETLARLELNSVQLKHYLDEIDRRMGRIEPHLQEITSVVHAAPTPPRLLPDPVAAPEPTRHPLPAAAVPIPPAPIPSPATPYSALPEPVGYKIIPTPPSLSFSISAPYPAFPRPGLATPPPPDPRIRSLTRVIAILAIALAVIAPTSAILLIRYFTPPRVSVVQAGSDQQASALGSLFSRIKRPLEPVSPSESGAKPDPRLAPKPSAGPDKTSRLAPATIVTTQSASEQAPRIRNANRDTSAAPDVEITPNGATFAQRSLPSLPAVSTPLIASNHTDTDVNPHPAEIVRTPPPAPRVVPPPQPAASREVADAEPRPPSIIHLPAGPVSVSGITMSSNLLYAPRPSYPADARLHNVEGDVAVRITVDRNGVVQSARIVKGPVPLQITTLDAVRSWRYKPYLVDGQPVEVETIVNVAYKISR